MCPCATSSLTGISSSPPCGRYRKTPAVEQGNGPPLADPRNPLVFPRNCNRVSGPDTNSCSGCHNKPYVGGGVDIAGNVFVLGQRFDFASFNPSDRVQASRGGRWTNWELCGATDHRRLPQDQRHVWLGFHRNGGP